MIQKQAEERASAEVPREEIEVHWLLYTEIFIHF